MCRIINEKIKKVKMFLYPVNMATKVTTHEFIWENAIFLSQLSPSSKARIQGVSIRNVH